MFTLKFIKEEESGLVTDVISCPHYQVSERANNVLIITTYASYCYDNGGVERRLSTEACDFETCLVENNEGKTIATYGK
jgi:hypothetical protein